MWNEDTSNQHTEAWAKRGSGQVLPRDYKQEPVVLQSDPRDYERIYRKFIIWLSWVEDCECWIADYAVPGYISHNYPSTVRSFTPIVQDNNHYDDNHISESVDARIERAEDYLDAIIPGRV